MTINKIEIQRMIDFLEQYPEPINMTSFRYCAACVIADVKYYCDAVDIIEKRTCMKRSVINDIFCNEECELYAEKSGANWLYPVDRAEDVTKEMVIDQLKKYL